MDPEYVYSSKGDYKIWHPREGFNSNAYLVCLLYLGATPMLLIPFIQFVQLPHLLMSMGKLPDNIFRHSHFCSIWILILFVVTCNAH